MLNIRSATREDCRLLWEWANDPEVRANSFHSGHILWDEHVAWFNQKMNDPNCHLYLIMDRSSEPVGQVRFDREEGHSAVSISIAKGKRGRGYGKEGLLSALKIFSRETGVRQVMAYVRPDNSSSIRMFEKAGFLNQGPCVVEGQDALVLSWVDQAKESK